MSMVPETASRAPRFRALAPLYAIAWVANTCAMLALASVLSDDRFTAATVGLTTLGFAASLVMRLVGVSRAVIPLVMAGAVSLLVVMGRSGVAAIFPGSSSVVASILPALVLAIFLVIFSFCLLDDDLLLFTIPPGLTILGLSGTENPNADMTAYFLVFVLAVIFVLSYQNYLRYVPADQAGRSGSALRPVLRWQLVSAAAVFALMAVVTVVASFPLKRAGRLTSYRFGVPASSLLSAITELSYNAMGREIQIGQGPPGLGDREVMRVQSAEYSNWRARTYDDYTGRGWTDSSGVRAVRVTPVPGAGRFEADLSGDREPEDTRFARRRPVTQKFTFLASWPAQSLPVLPEPAVVTFPGNPGAIRTTDGGSVLVGAPQIQAGIRYEVLSRAAPPAPAVLRRLPDADPNDPQLVPYLRVPSGSWRVESLARQVIVGRANNFDRAGAIETYLRDRYVYNLDVAPTPEGEDVVAYFLFTAREGYCDLFASSMVVMCRAVGIPARLATGFASGTRDEETQSYVVREMDAHAWVEVYFPRFGWVSFDPTPAASEELLGALEKGGLQWVLRRLRELVRFPALLLLAAVGLSIHLARLTVVDPWRQRREIYRAAGAGARGDVLRAYYQVHERLGKGVRRSAGQTPLEYCRAVADRAPAAPWQDDLEALTHAFVEARYGEAPVTDADAGRAVGLRDRVLAGLKAAPLG